MDDPRYPESGAYHESGHVVVAAVQGLRLSRHGIHMDSDGRGISYYEYRKPKRFLNQPSGVSREGTIIATLAGLLAQQKFYPACSVCGASDDQNIVDMLITEIEEEGGLLGTAALDAQLKLPGEAKRLVQLHWPAIEVVGRTLWDSPEVPRIYEPEPGWSTMLREKRLDGSRLVELLKPFDIHASIWDPDTVVD